MSLSPSPNAGVRKSLAAALLLLGSAPAAFAEPLIVVRFNPADATGNLIELYDSKFLSSPPLDKLEYRFPSGVVVDAVLGADTDPDDGKFYIVGRDNTAGTCRIFFVDLLDKTGVTTAQLAKVRTSVGIVTPPAAACAATEGELEIFKTAAAAADAGWTIADDFAAAGGAVRRYMGEPSNTYQAFAVTDPNALPASARPQLLRGMGFRRETGFSPATEVKRTGVFSDASIREVTLTTNAQGARVANFGAATALTPSATNGPVPVISGRTSLDVVESTGSYILFSNGQIFSVAPDAKSAPISTPTNTTPSNTIAVLTAGRLYSDIRVLENAAGQKFTLTTDKGSFGIALPVDRPAAANTAALCGTNGSRCYDFAGFRIDGVGTGGEALVTFYLDLTGRSAPNGYVKCSADGTKCSAFAPANVAVDRNRLFVKLTDGGAGDSDAVAGTITDPGAPATFLDSDSDTVLDPFDACPTTAAAPPSGCPPPPPPPVNGTCGSGNGTTTATAPSGAMLCTAGTASSVTDGASGFSWSCAGSNGGTTASCSATKPASTATPTPTTTTPAPAAATDSVVAERGGALAPALLLPLLLMAGLRRKMRFA